MRTWRTVTTRSPRHPSPSAGDDECGSDAKRAFLLLSGRVGTDRRPDLDVARVDGQAVAADDDREAVEPTRRRARLLLADAVVLGAVAGALEPLRRRAPGHATAEVHA